MRSDVVCLSHQIKCRPSEVRGLCSISDLLVSAVEADGLPAADVVYAEIAHRKMAQSRDRAMVLALF